MFDVYVVPLLMSGLGIVMIVPAFTTTIPKAEDLSEVRGHLDSYYFQQSGRGRDDYTTIIIFTDGSRFWTNAVSKETAATFFKQRRAEVRTYVEPASTDAPIDGAVKTYGLSVNGQQVRSLEGAIGREKFIVRFGFPAIALFSLAAALFIHRYQKAKHRSSTC